MWLWIVVSTYTRDGKSALLSGYTKKVFYSCVWIKKMYLLIQEEYLFEFV